MTKDENYYDAIRRQLNYRPVEKDYWVNSRSKEIEAYRQRVLEEMSRINAEETPGWLDKNTDWDSVKNQLINALLGRQNYVVKQAVCQLQRQGWLQDGTLRNISLEGVNLSGVAFVKLDFAGGNLRNANLQGAYFVDSNLQRADFSDANLAEIVIDTSNMAEAIFDRADMHLGWVGNDLERASLKNVNFENGVFVYSNMRDASFLGANLKNSWFIDPMMHGVDLLDTYLYKTFFHFPRVDEKIRLPDGTMYQPFNFKRQLHRYTEPDHPLFWHKSKQSQE